MLPRNWWTIGVPPGRLGVAQIPLRNLQTKQISHSYLCRRRHAESVFTLLRIPKSRVDETHADEAEDA